MEFLKYAYWAVGDPKARKQRQQGRNLGSGSDTETKTAPCEGFTDRWRFFFDVAGNELGWGLESYEP